MVEVPAATAVAKPLLFTVATEVVDELQMTWVLVSKLVPSENVPVAVNCTVIPGGVLGMLGLAGLSDMELRVTKVTVMVVIPEMAPEVAVITAVPRPIPMTKPVLSTVAMESLDELHVACFVMSKVVPSENMPVTASCTVKPWGMAGLFGDTDMEERAEEVTVSVVFPAVLPKVAVMVVVPGIKAFAKPRLSTVATEAFEEVQAA